MSSELINYKYVCMIEYEEYCVILLYTTKDTFSTQLEY